MRTVPSFAVETERFGNKLRWTGMDRLKLILVIVVTALVSAALTSVFWLVAFNLGQSGARGAPAEPCPRAAGLVAEQLVRGPTGLAIPVVGVRAEQLTDTYTAARANGRVHDAIDIMAPRGTPVIAAAPGTVEKLFFSKGGGGITAYVRSPDGAWQYYYAHLDGYAPAFTRGRRSARAIRSAGSARPATPPRTRRTSISRSTAWRRASAGGRGPDQSLSVACWEAQ